MVRNLSIFHLLRKDKIKTSTFFKAFLSPLNLHTEIEMGEKYVTDQ